MSKTIRLSVNINSVEDSDVFEDLSMYHGQDRARRARALMRTGRNVLERGDRTYTIKPSPRAEGTAQAAAASEVRPTTAPQPGSLEAFDSLDLDMDQLMRNLKKTEQTTS